MTELTEGDIENTVQRTREPRAGAKAPQRQISLHSQILADIQSHILSGEWAPGHRIPFEHELTEQYSCSRMTVSKALTQLARSGLIERRRKAGSFVTRPHSQSAILEIRDVAAEVEALGLPYAFTILLRRERRATSEDRVRIAVSPGTRVLAVTCRHDAAHQPFCYEDRLINLVSAPQATDETFASISPGPWLLAQAPWTTAEHRIRAVGASGDAARALRIADGAACLVIERRTWMADQPVTQVMFTYPGGAHELLADFTPSQS